MMPKLKIEILVVVGSKSDQICSVGAFARSEYRALQNRFSEVKLLEPDSASGFNFQSLKNYRPDIILLHNPSLYDRINPINALKTILWLKLKFRTSKIISIVHEFSEAPQHWRLRQMMVNFLADATIVNTVADYNLVKNHKKNLFKFHLGPTLFDLDLINPLKENNLELTQARLNQKINLSKAEIISANGINANAKIILHPGLLTPGKGINFLKKAIPYFSENACLILMGGTGPKEKDKKFADETIAELKLILKNKLYFISAPSDEVFKKYLIAADLILLPYDQGLSERRSSFLSAMCCGANVLTTAGRYTQVMNLDNTGVYQIPLIDWQNSNQSQLQKISNALNAPWAEQERRRIANLNWASQQLWEVRINNLEQLFIKNLLIKA